MKNPLQDIQESLQKAWSETASSLHGVEEEVTRRLRQLKERTPDLHQGSEEVQRVLADLRRRLQESGEAVEQKLESAYGKLRTPLFDEVARLKIKAEQLSRRIESQLHGGKQAATSEECAEADDKPE